MVADPLSHLRDAPIDRPFVVAQLGQSLDGRIATPTGASRYINGSCALDHLHRLRAHVDAVIVGVGTVIADDPALTVRRVEGRNPARVFIDPNGRLPRDAKCVASDCADRYVIRTRNGAAQLPRGRNSRRGGRRRDSCPRPFSRLSSGAGCGKHSGGRRSPDHLLVRGLRRGSTGCMSLWRRDHWLWDARPDPSAHRRTG